MIPMTTSVPKSIPGNLKDEAPPGLLAFCHEWSARMDDLSGDAEKIAFFRKELPVLLRRSELFREILEKMAEGHPYPDIRKAGIFDREVPLYIDPARRFSLRLYFHDAGEYTSVHDHGSWGISGTPFGKLGVVKYRREDDGGVEGYAKVAEIRRIVLPEYGVDVTHPLDKGIHQTGSPGATPVPMVSVYGKPVRRLYINEFDPVANRVTRRYPLKLRRKMLARDVLGSL